MVVESFLFSKYIFIHAVTRGSNNKSSVRATLRGRGHQVQEKNATLEDMHATRLRNIAILSGALDDNKGVNTETTV